MRILFAGDTHGSVAQMEKVIYPAARDNEVDIVFQLGDFGYRFAEKFTGACSRLSLDSGIPLFWIDGNHDDHSYLIERGAFSAPYGGTPELWPGVFYVPRGQHLYWEDSVIVAVGGAYSVDRVYRTLGESWWAEEEITDEDIERALDWPMADILLSHDAPDSPALNGYLDKFFSSFGEVPDSLKSRKKLLRLVEHHEPKLVIHGHYHHRYTTTIGKTRVEGLSCDGYGEDSYLILDVYPDGETGPVNLTGAS